MLRNATSRAAATTQQLQHAVHCLLQDRPPCICAHGGDSTVYPPNTAAAYAAALRAGADCMEVDVSLTSDLVLVALHDRDLQQLLGQPTAKVSSVVCTGQ
jgi:glycerophosphoryl diester phosphodiesterase